MTSTASAPFCGARTDPLFSGSNGAMGDRKASRQLLNGASGKPDHAPSRGVQPLFLASGMIVKLCKSSCVLRAAPSASSRISVLSAASACTAAIAVSRAS